MRTFHLAGVLLGILAGPAAAQVIPIRTAPIVQADGFEILPSRALGMGGVAIALSDTLGDLSVNPATGARVSGARVFGSPVAYDVSRNAGSGHALPVGMVARTGDWFGAGALAVQTVERAGLRDQIFGGPVLLDGGQEDAAPSRGSVYGFGMLGRSWPGSGVSVGGSVLAARRNAMDALEGLYGDSRRVEPTGRVAVVRLGLLGEWSGARSLEAVAVHSRMRTTHDVTYADGYWDPGTQQPVFETREERNADQADVWAIQLVHARPLAPGWRIGWLLTGNRVSYPSVPRYDTPRDGLMNIASGRGSAHAYNLGVGLASVGGPAHVGVDLIYEPIWSRVWGEAETATVTRQGGVIPVGGTTVDNRLRFSNAVVRLGASHEWPLAAGNAVDVRLGLATRVVDYRLAQFDHRQDAGRDHDERWTEWTPSWGTSFRLGDMEIRYHGSVVGGTKRPGTEPASLDCPFCLTRPGLTVIPGPPAPSELGRVGIVTQQLFVSYRLGHGRREGGAR